MIEDALREAFAAHAGQGPQDVAGDRARTRAEAAMLRAARIRQRRAMGSALAGVLIVALVSLATFQAVTSRARSGGPSVNAASDLGESSPAVAPEPSTGGQTQPEASDSPMPIEMVSNGEIYKEDKTTLHLSLPDKGQPESIYKATDGYLVIVALPTTGQQLLLLDGQGNQKVLLPSVQRVVVSPSGDRVAWLVDNTVAVANRRTDKPALDDPQQITAPALSQPVAFLGANVVLSRSTPDGSGVDGFDLWYPDHKAYVPSWDPDVLRVLGPRKDGKALYAQVRSDDDSTMCLAVLLAAQPFSVTDQRCGLPLPDGVDGGISPDGHWLAYPVAGANQVAVLDLTSQSDPAKPRLITLKAGCSRVFWVGDNSLVVDADGQFVAIDPRQGHQETAQGKSDGTVPIEPLRAITAS
jgi:hypothetical protein